MIKDKKKIGSRWKVTVKEQGKAELKEAKEKEIHNSKTYETF